ncbi:MAG: hypothetical protein M1816_001568 [Peltula sp. TS41687]|nr:MAG: hypothetical protein M1816_001568 [Peltula sp. TS41687]
MADPSGIQEFPDINNKLAAPTKKSLFERQKAEAEAKRLREEAETAAVYEDFVKSFEDEGTTSHGSGSRDRLGTRESSGPTGGGSLGGPPKRHFAGPPPGRGGGIGGSRVGGPPSSGLGSLGPPPSSLSRKRGHDGSYLGKKEGNQGLFAFEDVPTGTTDAKAAFKELEDEDEQDNDESKAERAAPKPTLHLSSLPPGTSPAVIKSYLPSNLSVDTVRILPPAGPGSSERRSISAIVTLTKDMPANDVDGAVNGLQNRYLGCGYYLSISRQLSSAAISAGAPISTGTNTLLSSMPFGARPDQSGPSGSLGRAPPPSSIHRGGFAPPTSYGSGHYGRGPPLVQVPVAPPSDLKQLRLIHKTLESLLTHGPEFEALLMSRVEVQRDERWAWLWDPRSPGGVWYRWRLWEILSGSRGRDNRRAFQNGTPNMLFEGAAAWIAPQKELRYEYTTRLDEFVSDSDYDSSEDESGDEDNRHSHQHYGGGGPQDPISGGNGADAKPFLNPLQKAKLTHLLARLPTSTAKLRKGDLARITAFTIEHAGEGADEVVEMIVSNIQKPFSSTSANPDWRRDRQRTTGKTNEEETDEKEGSKDKDQEDTSASKLIALYVLSDILSSSSTSGVRHAWKYRQLFETELRRRMIFEGLGQLEKKLHWGRLRADKWKRSVGGVLTLWEGWCVFPQASQEQFVSAFTNPPSLTTEETNVPEATSDNASVTKSKWKTVDVKAQVSEDSRPLDLNAPPPVAKEDDPVHDVDGEPMLDDGDLDGEPMEDLDGEPMEEDDIDGQVMDEDDGQPMEVDMQIPQKEEKDEVSGDKSTEEQPTTMTESKQNTTHGGGGASSARRRRPKAEDMFADSDED